MGEQGAYRYYGAYTDGAYACGMMGWFRETPTTSRPITVGKAKANAQQYLDAYLPGTTVGDVTTFYCYYHLDVLQVSGTYGMLSVNDYTGQVWYPNWHGTFVQEAEL